MLNDLPGIVLNSHSPERAPFSLRLSCATIPTQPVSGVCHDGNRTVLWRALRGARAILLPLVANSLHYSCESSFSAWGKGKTQQISTVLGLFQNKPSGNKSFRRSLHGFLCSYSYLYTFFFLIWRVNSWVQAVVENFTEPKWQAAGFLWLLREEQIYGWLTLWVLFWNGRTSFLRLGIFVSLLFVCILSIFCWQLNSPVTHCI